MRKHIKFLVYISSMVILLGICGLPVLPLQVQATSSELELLKTAVAHLKDELVTAEAEIDNLQSAVEALQSELANNAGISNIERTASDGNVDTYTITLTDGTAYSFTVANGQDGKDGSNGKDGVNGKNGVDGKDGTDGKDGVDGKDGIDGKDGVDGKDGEDGVGIVTIEKTAANNNTDTYTITLTNGETYNFLVTNGLNGKDGADADASMAVVAMVIALISFVGNMVMGVFRNKRKK